LAKPKKEEGVVEETQPKSESTDEKSSTTPKGTGVSFLDALFTLFFSQRKTLVPSGTENFYEYHENGCYMKVPVRQECISEQPQPTVHYLVPGWEWSSDGTITSPVDPLVGIAHNDATWSALSYDPTAVWQGANWYKYHGGRIYHVLTNWIKSNQILSEADMVKITKAILAYEEIARGAVILKLYFDLGLYRLAANKIQENVLATSSGSALHSTISEQLSQVVKCIAENFFPWPVLDFWLDRGCKAYSLQYPYYKYLIFIPNSQAMYAHVGIARLFDAYIGANQAYHPQTYLQAQGLWNKFRDNIVPLLWEKRDWEYYIGGQLYDELEKRNYRPVNYDADMFFYYLNKFYTHPFDESSGVGIGKLPKRAVGEDAVKTMDEWYWDGSGSTAKGNKFYLPVTSFLGPKAITSPWLDPTRFAGIVDNYAANDDGISVNYGQIIQKVSDNDFAEIGYDELMPYFLKFAFEFQKLELVEPEADISLESTSYLWKEMLIYINRIYCVPFNMPDRHWYMDYKKLRRLYANYLNLNLSDIELYKVQKPSGWRNTAVTQDPSFTTKQ
jgi:hypothetical protein